MFNKGMGTRKTSFQKLNPTTLTNPDVVNDKHSGRVDINNLLDRARKERNDERRISLIYTSLFSLIVIIAVTILSF
tara:strand:- start:33 stop:260 length:228 start_codon:yes stop_codon:yes gene_type:complete